MSKKRLLPVASVITAILLAFYPAPNGLSDDYHIAVQAPRGPETECHVLLNPGQCPVRIASALVAANRTALPIADSYATDVSGVPCVSRGAIEPSLCVLTSEFLSPGSCPGPAFQTMSRELSHHHRAVLRRRPRGLQWASLRIGSADAVERLTCCSPPARILCCLSLGMVMAFGARDLAVLNKHGAIRVVSTGLGLRRASTG